MERVIITRPVVGICAMQVCCVKDATDKEILRKCNSENPSGTTNGWCEVIRENDKDGWSAPVQCDEHKDRLHILVLC